MALDPTFANPPAYALRGPIAAATRTLAAPLFALTPGDPELTELAEGVAAFCALAGPRARVSFFALATLVAVAMLLRMYIARIDAPTALARVEHGALAPAFHGVKALLCIVYFETPAVSERNGLGTRCMGAP